MNERGIDVSSYQGHIDWQKVKADGVQFAILKVIRKDLTPDNTFEENWKGCQKAGIIIYGVYNYSYATTVEKAKADAKKVVEILKDRKPMVWLDIEDNCQKGLGFRLVEIIAAYKDVIEKAGMTFGIYTGLSFYKNYLQPYEYALKHIPFWIARYPVSKDASIKQLPPIGYKPSINNTLFGWQYSSKGIINGIAGHVDMNIWYVKVEKNSYSTTNRYNTPLLKYGDSGSNVQLLQELLLKNKFKTAVVTVGGKQVRKNLVADGKFGPITESALKRYQGYVGLPQTGTSTIETWNKLIEQ